MRTFFYTVIFSFLLLLIGLATPTYAATENKVLIEAFVRKDCVHCQAEKKFLKELVKKENNILLTYYDLADPDNKKLFEQFVKHEKLALVTPITIVGNSIIEGFDASETTGKLIQEAVVSARGSKNIFVKDYLKNPSSKDFNTQKSGATCAGEVCLRPQAPTFRVPFTNVTFTSRSFSLPVLSVVLGTIDGFNPCAMWVLVTFLVVLSQVGDRKKMWQFAGTFILAETIMYYLILTVWYSAWDFVGLDKVVTPLVGALAIASGIFFLNEFRVEQIACKVTNPKQRAQMMSRIHKLTQNKFTVVTFISIIFLAFSVNVIEFACSIGIPQAFTKILELNNLGFFARQLYMFIYILGYMLDDFIVFGVVLYSFDKIGMTTKYTRWSHLAGGILMLILGLLLIFRPQWLRFG